MRGILTKVIRVEIVWHDVAAKINSEKSICDWYLFGLKIYSRDFRCDDTISKKEEKKFGF